MEDVKEREETGPVMMYGTNGYRDYLAIARKGNVVLGIKPNSMRNGKDYGHPGTVWFGARLRSAPAEDIMAALDAQTKAMGGGDADNVVKFQKNPESIETAWPGVEWEKINSKRASTTIGALIPGNLDGKLEAETLLEQLADGGVAKKLADYLASIAGEEHLVLTKDEIANWLTENVYGKVAEQLRKQLHAQEMVQEEMGKTIGTFGMQAALLKKVYGSLDQEAEGVEDADDSQTASDDLPDDSSED